jgi:hypothetical protein
MVCRGCVNQKIIVKDGRIPKYVILYDLFYGYRD